MKKKNKSHVKPQRRGGPGLSLASAVQPRPGNPPPGFCFLSWVRSKGERRPGGPEQETLGSASHDFTAGILFPGLEREGKAAVTLAAGPQGPRGGCRALLPPEEAGTVPALTARHEGKHPVPPRRRLVAQI